MADMRLIMTLAVRDEADIVASNLDFHLAQGVDFVIATDNLSTDGTREILERYEAQGRLHLLHEPDDRFQKGGWVTRMARLARRQFGATWVINNDADEFWCAEGGDLKRALGTVRWWYGTARVPRVNFPPVPEESGAFHERMVVREATSYNALGQPLPGKVVHRGHRGVTVSQGSHRATARGFRRAPTSPPMTVLHYPLRTYEQAARKVARVRPGTGHGASLQWLRELLDAGRLREWYDSQCLTPERLQRGLDDGTLVVDRRVAIVLERVRSSDGERSRPSQD